MLWIALTSSVRWDTEDTRIVLMFVLFLVVIFTLVLWGVHKTTGRSYRDMVLLLLAGFVLIGVMMSAMVFFREPLDSPDRGTRQLTSFVFRYGFLAIAGLVWWGFNRLERIRRQRKSLRENRAFDNHPPEPPRMIG